MMASRDGLARRQAGRRTSVRADIAPVPDSVSYDTLVEACRRLTTDELEVALKHRYLPLAFAPEPEAYVAAGPAGLATARSHGRPVAGYADPGDLVRALEAVYGDEICRRAAWHLAAVQPELSAVRRLTPGQAAALVIAAAGIATGFYVYPAAAAIAASVVFGLVFLAVIGLRLLCLLAPREPARPPRLADAELPVYTVLVPLFRETAVLDQLVAALVRLDYPVLCIKSTKRCLSPSAR